MALEMRRDGGGSGLGFDPSNLHLRKELTQIKKAARALRDPGTTSSWRSPLSSSRSAAAEQLAYAKNHYSHLQHHQQLNSLGELTNDNGATSSTINPVHEHHTKLPLLVEGTDLGVNGSVNNDRNSSNGNVRENQKEKRVFLYNWKMQKSESEMSRQQGEDRSSSISPAGEEGEGSADDSISDARNNVGIDSRSDTCLSDRYMASLMFKCKDTNFTPSIRRGIKKRSKKGNYSSAIMRSHNDRLQQKNILSRGAKRAMQNIPNIGLGTDDSVSLIDQSDDTEDYCNSEDLRRGSAASPLLARLKNKNWAQSSNKLLRSHQKEDSSYSYSTPALSASSYNLYALRNPSTVGSWDATTASLNDGDDEVDDPLDLPGRQGCGIPCYWSRRSTPKYRGGSGSCYSPSFSDTLRRKGSNILCGSQNMYQRKRRGSSFGSNKRRLSSRAAAQGLIPLLTDGVNGRAGTSMGTGNSDDELSTNFGELDLEALSRLDGRRWSASCRSQEGLEVVALNGEGEEEGTPDNIRSLSQKYRPMFFEELIGQNIVVHSLMNAISRGRVAPVYLFQGPRGTGKTSTARIFAAALNCLASEETKPCGVCRECADFVAGKSKDLKEVDGTNKKGVDKIRHLLKSISEGPLSAFSGYRVFVVDECHLLPSKTWLAFLKFLEEPPPRVVFIFVTTDLESVPRTVLSRCQKFLFNKIREGDIVARLRKIAADENLEVESDALDLIALNADGSLRDAETMLDQLSLLGKRITTSLVNELVGVVSDEKLLELLELAMSSETAETVKRARELMDSGVDPIVLMSQLASLIMDIIAGTYSYIDGKHSDSFLGGGSLTETELDKLKHALKLLSEAEKQLRVSSERSTWFTATLLQLGSVSSSDPTHSGSSRRQSSKTTEDDRSSTFREAAAHKLRPDANYAIRKSASPSSYLRSSPGNSNCKEATLSLTDTVSFNSKPTHSQYTNGEAAVSAHSSNTGKTISGCVNSKLLDDIWIRCIGKCHSKTLRQLLQTYGKLVSLSEDEGAFIAYVAFGDGDIKTRAERFLSSITNSFEIVLRSNVEVRIILLPDGDTSVQCVNTAALPNSDGQKRVPASSMINGESITIHPNLTGDNVGPHQDPQKMSMGRSNDLESNLALELNSTAVNDKTSSTKVKSEIPVQRIESIIREQRLETAWLQAMEKGTPGSMSRSKPEKNQVLPQDGIYHNNQLEPASSLDLSSKHWEDELNHEIKSLKINDGKSVQKEQFSKRVERFPMSPSLLHDSSFPGNFSTENMGYESGSGAGGCSALFCWNSAKPHRRGKVKQGTQLRSHKGGRFMWFGECARSRRTGNRFQR